MATIGIIMPFSPFVARTDSGRMVVVMLASIVVSRARCQTSQQYDEL
ncbi:hypothetical protein [Agrococcus sp. Ld7]